MTGKREVYEAIAKPHNSCLPINQNSLTVYTAQNILPLGGRFTRPSNFHATYKTKAIPNEFEIASVLYIICDTYKICLLKISNLIMKRNNSIDDCIIS